MNTEQNFTDYDNTIEKQEVNLETTENSNLKEFLDSQRAIQYSKMKEADIQFDKEQTLNYN